MSYANGTPFLNLAQTVGTDHRDWFDENEAKLDLDTKMKTLWDERTSTTAILAALQESVATLDTDVTSLSGIVSGHTTTIATINESLVLINTALNALNTQVVGKFDSVGIADAYDATHGIYAVGDVVTYNGQRYVCITAVTAAEPFDVSKWNAEDIQTVIAQIESNLSEVLHMPDYSNLLVNETTYNDLTTAKTYTATENCYAMYTITTLDNTIVHTLINNVEVAQFSSQYPTKHPCRDLLKAGDTITISLSSGTSGGMEFFKVAPLD